MTEFLQSHPEWIVIALIALAVIVLVFGIIIVVALCMGREVVVTRTGFSFPVKTSSAQMHNISEHIDRIDREAKYNLRNATLSLPIKGITDTKQAEFIRLRMLLPLLFATYENHHTREIQEHTMMEYMENKINQIINCIGRTKVIERQYVEMLVIAWTRKMVAVVATSCRAKIQIYEKYMVGADRDTKEVLQHLIDKNNKYLASTSELNTYSAVRNKAIASGVVHPIDEE